MLRTANVVLRASYFQAKSTTWANSVPKAAVEFHTTPAGNKPIDKDRGKKTAVHKDDADCTFEAKPPPTRLQGREFAPDIVPGDSSNDVSTTIHNTFSS